MLARSLAILPGALPKMVKMDLPKSSSAFWRVRRIAGTRLAIRRASATKARDPIFQELIDFQMRRRGKAPGVNQDAPQKQANSTSR
jgi:hypothetical protein